MKRNIVIVCIMLLSCMLGSCNVYEYYNTDDLYYEQYDGIVQSDNVDINIVITHGTPYYYRGSIIYYLYNGLYYYPYFYDNCWYMRIYNRPYYRYYRPHFRPNRYDYRFDRRYNGHRNWNRDGYRNRGFGGYRGNDGNHRNNNDGYRGHNEHHRNDNVGNRGNSENRNRHIRYGQNDSRIRQQSGHQNVRIQQNNNTKIYQNRNSVNTNRQRFGGKR